MSAKLSKYNTTILVLCVMAIVWFMYFGRYGDPVANFYSGDLFPIDWWFAPCNLCTVARVLTIVITILSVIILISKKYASLIFISIFFVWLIGFFMEMYQYYLQMGLWWNDSTFCDPNVPCSRIDLMYGDFITIPFMALVFFIVVIILAWLWYKSRNTTSDLSV